MADVMDNVVKMLRQYFKVEINDILAAILVILENDDMGKALNLLRQIVDPLPQDIKDPVDFVQQKFQYLFNTHIISGGHLNSTSKDGHKIDPIKARQTFRPNSDAPFSSTGSLKSKEATKESNKKNERDFKPGDGNKSNTLEKVESDSSDSSDTSSSSLNHVSPAQLLANQILSSSKLGSTFSPKSTIPKSDTTKVKTSLQNVKSLKTNDKSLSVENSTINIPNIETTVSADRPKLVAKKVEPNSVSTSVLQETIPSKSEDSDSSSDSSEDEETQKVQTKASGLNNLDKKAPIHQKPQTGNDPKHQEKKNSKPSSALKKKKGQG
ncbi:hypothetical protein RF11_09248 [Thelohanellus kitauei]|uniref:Uncharacterized protein n=1 Tax=Thelohanellus kitauei TaxID=669202 RepID=A0A0C2IHN4_THEKT|nr:hypothetical protein RF11_09248 [Thelohanellus kitauei]